VGWIFAWKGKHNTTPRKPAGGRYKKIAETDESGSRKIREEPRYQINQQEGKKRSQAEKKTW